MPVQPARILFAISLIAWGIEQFIAGQFVAGRPPKWPVDIPGEVLFAYSTGALLIATGASVLVKRYPVPLLTITGIAILLWSGIRNLYVLLTNLNPGGQLTATNKSLTIGFGALLVASTLAQSGFRDATARWVQVLVNKLAPAARYAMGIFLLSSGVQHFLYSQFVSTLIPTWIPGAIVWTYLAGIALVLSGLGVVVGYARATVLSGWMIFTWVFVLHLPRASGVPGNMNEWIAVFEALATSSLLFLLGETLKNAKRTALTQMPT